MDAGADTIGWHLTHHHQRTVSRATIHRILTRAGTVTPTPATRPRPSYIRFQADQPNECWQSDLTHHRLTRPDGRPGTDIEIISWVDDHSRFVLHVAAHPKITRKIVVATFHQARPKATPSTDRTADSHDRLRSAHVDSNSKLTLRVSGRLHHIGIGRTHARTPVLLLVQDRQIRIIHQTTGQLLRELTLDPTRTYQPSRQK
ncbi:hypothetical protein [Frankia sp. R82]|uniref:hypothetical protein n=1 Tax=Frankia sp. R82 TaxID=2950553 RepID=UPI0020448245|nr:hypothetical protein [Frankia sp. R82]MCM3887600.1 hypothetical protein [Frankia sp. R82]